MSYPFGALLHIEESFLPESSKSTGSISSPIKQATPLHSRSPTQHELDTMPIGPGAHYTGPVQHSQSEVSKPPKIDSIPAGAFVYHERVTRPPDVHSRRVTLTSPSEIETPVTPSGARTPNELEMSRPPSPRLGGAAEIVQSWNHPHMNKWRMLSACLCLVGNGMNDSAPGALLPTIEKHYNVDYATVALIFIANAAGFILAAFFVQALDKRIGRARSLMLTDAVCSAAYILMAVAPPFPAFAFAFCVSGWAMATSLALNNVFVANLANATVLLGWFHGSYGIGGIIGPIIATSLVTHGVLFSYFYFVLLGIRLFSLVFSGWAFYHFERDAHEAADGTLLDGVELSRPSNTESSPDTSDQLPPAPEAKREKGQLLTALRNRSTLVGALFIFAYQGAEVSVSGWVISFLIHYRNGAPSRVGYVTSGFWAGITLGRFLLTYPASLLGEKRFVFLATAGSILFQLLIWFVPNVVGDAISIALLGFLLGPIYPSATTVFARLIPRRVQNTALAFVSSAGSSGGAVWPFVTGLLAQERGTWVLHPVCVGLFLGMVGCWVGLPRVGKRRE